MPSILADLTREWMPHGTCFQWDWRVLWLIVIGEGLTALAYARIPWLLWRQARRHWRAMMATGGRRSVATAFWFAAFIASCGGGHALAIVAIWHGYYGLFALWTLLTGLISQVTVNRLELQQDEAETLWGSPQWQSIVEAAQALATHLQATDDRRPHG